MAIGWTNAFVQLRSKQGAWNFLAEILSVTKALCSAGFGSLLGCRCDSHVITKRVQRFAKRDMLRAGGVCVLSSGYKTGGSTGNDDLAAE